jgi:hypothetical protein
MKRYKLGFGNRTVLEQIAICRRVVGGIAKLPAKQQQGMAKYPVADSVAEAAEAVARVDSLKTALRAALVRRNSKVDIMRRHATSAAAVIAVATDGDPEALLTAGVGVAKPKSPVGQPAAPTRLRVVETNFEGAVRLRWQRPVRRCAFIIQMTTAPSALRGWKSVGISIKQSSLVTGLKSGVKGWFRVGATNSQGQGPWSQPVSARVK